MILIYVETYWSVSCFAMAVLVCSCRSLMLYSNNNNTHTPAYNFVAAHWQQWVKIYPSK